MRILYALVQWVIAGSLNLAMISLGLVAVALGLLGDGQYRTPKMWTLWGNVEDIPYWWEAEHGQGRFAKWWWMAVRNPASGIDKYIPDSPIVKQRGHNDMEAAGFKWRYRNTKWRDSFRMTWGEERPRKGKHEFYIGFKIGPDVHNNSFTIQLR